MPLALNLIPKKVLCYAEKSSVIWAEPHSRSSAEQFDRTEHSFDHYDVDYVYDSYITKGQEISKAIFLETLLPKKQPKCFEGFHP